MLIAIFDNKASDIVGIIQIHRHVATAIRMFRDVAEAPNSQIQKHPEDFDLVQVGWLSDDSKTIEPVFELVMKGSALLAATKRDEQPSLQLEN